MHETLRKYLAYFIVASGAGPIIITARVIEFVCTVALEVYRKIFGFGNHLQTYFIPFFPPRARRKEAFQNVFEGLLDN